MTIRWSSAAIFLLWLTAMSWLVAAKIAPRFRRGDPPQTKYAVERDELPVGWQIRFDERPIGECVSWVEPSSDGLIVHNRLRFDEFPIQQVLPPWLRAIGVGKGLTGPISFRVGSRVEVSSEQRLRRFVSSIRLADRRDLIRVEANAVGDRIEFVVSAEGVKYESSLEMPEELSLNDELSPAARMPDLFVGRSWVQPVYSPLHSPSQPIERLHAVVERDEVLFWSGRAVPVFLVEYRREGSTALFWNRRPESRMWVSDSGDVLQHETSLFGAELTFIRTTTEAARQFQASMRDEGP